MSTTSLTDVFKELFTAPLQAVTEAEEEYRRIWADWLKVKLLLIKNAGGNANIEKILDTAPAINLDGRIDVGITMRIASVRSKETNIKAGLGLGPIHISGGFGFMEKTTQESVLQASTTVLLSNNEKNLREYLAEHGVAATSATELENAVKFLGTKAAVEKPPK